MIINYEFKARVDKPDDFEKKLLYLHPVFKGEDHQKDTYFKVKAGRLKLREGNIENSLIHYEREDRSGAKQSSVILYKHDPDPALKDILIKTLGIRVVVEKSRRIYFIDNVKFHFDKVKDLGSFIEVEAIDDDGTIGIDKLKEQCNRYAAFFGLKDADYIDRSYSDMIPDPG